MHTAFMCIYICIYKTSTQNPKAHLSTYIQQLPLKTQGLKPQLKHLLEVLVLLPGQLQLYRCPLRWKGPRFFIKSQRRK